MTLSDDCISAYSSGECVFLLLAKLIPLYVLITLGYLAGRFFHARRETVASLLLYFIVPPVVFDGVATTRLDASVLFLPVVFYLLCVVICLAFFVLASVLWRDSTRNVLAYAAGTGNNGYFGLPLVMALFGPQAFGIGVIAGLGFSFYETTLGLFILAKSNRTAWESVRTILRIPLLYALVAGLLFHAAGLTLPAPAHELALSFRGAFTVLGMMLIGMSIAGTPRQHLFLDRRFLGLAFFAKFVVWPGLMIMIVAIDHAFFGFFPPAARDVMLAFSLVPMAANTVVYATELKTHPEKAASAVLLSTLFALLYIPAMAAMLLTR